MSNNGHSGVTKINGLLLFYMEMGLSTRWSRIYSHYKENGQNYQKRS